MNEYVEDFVKCINPSEHVKGFVVVVKLPNGTVKQTDSYTEEVIKDIEKDLHDQGYTNTLIKEVKEDAK